jgi:hypothetical protein
VADARRSLPARRELRPPPGAETADWARDLRPRVQEPARLCHHVLSRIVGATDYPYPRIWRRYGRSVGPLSCARILGVLCVSSLVGMLAPGRPVSAEGQVNCAPTAIQRADAHLSAVRRDCSTLDDHPVEHPELMFCALSRVSMPLPSAAITITSSGGHRPNRPDPGCRSGRSCRPAGSEHATGPHTRSRAVVRMHSEPPLRRGIDPQGGFFGRCSEQGILCPAWSARGACSRDVSDRAARWSHSRPRMC